MREAKKADWSADIVLNRLYKLLGLVQEPEEYFERIKQLQADRDALQWKTITPENFPKCGDEVWSKTFGAMPVEGPDRDYPNNNANAWTSMGWTHFRPINAPKEDKQAESH